MADWLKDFMGRTPFAILGAIGLLSMASQFINLADDIENWLKIWKAVTRPPWEWIADLVGWEMPNWLKDYLTVGVIHAGMSKRAYRMTYHFIDNHPDNDIPLKKRSGWPSPLIISDWILPFAIDVGCWPLKSAKILFEKRAQTRIYSNIIDTFTDQRKADPEISKMLVRAKLMTRMSKFFVNVYAETLVCFAFFLALSGAWVLAE